MREHFGGLDVAFLNAGVSDWRPFEDHTEDSYDRLLDINVKSVFFLTQALVPLLTSHGIRFNAISPGPVDTPLHHKLGIEDPEQQAAVLEAISSGIPLGRLGKPEEITEAVVYLASDASAFTVGQDLIPDGGTRPGRALRSRHLRAVAVGCAVRRTAPARRSTPRSDPHRPRPRASSAVPAARPPPPLTPAIRSRSGSIASSAAFLAIHTSPA